MFFLSFLLICISNSLLYFSRLPTFSIRLLKHQYHFHFCISSLPRFSFNIYYYVPSMKRSTPVFKAPSILYFSVWCLFLLNYFYIFVAWHRSIYEVLSPKQIESIKKYRMEVTFNQEYPWAIKRLNSWFCMAILIFFHFEFSL